MCSWLMFHLLFTKLRMATSPMAKDFADTGMRTSHFTDGIMSKKALIALKTSNFSHIIICVTCYNVIPAIECHCTKTSLDYIPAVYRINKHTLFSVLQLWFQFSIHTWRKMSRYQMCSRAHRRWLT